MATLEELKSGLLKALNSNDLDAIVSGAAEIKKVKVEIEEKNRAARLVTAKKATSILDEAVKAFCKQTPLVTALKELATVYGKDRSVSIVIPLNDIDSASVMPLERASAGRAAGGGSGKTKDALGMSLAEVFEKFANASERTQMSEIDPSNNSGTWALKNRVKNRAVKEGLIGTAS